MSYVDIPATRFSKARKVRARVKIFEATPDGTFYNKALDRSIDGRDFQTYVSAAALDGVTIKIKK
jgi:hypothetical protein